jgi:hypothetical protein
MKRSWTVLALTVAFGGAAVAAQHKARVAKERPGAVMEPASQNFDGSWVLEVTTTVGPCPGSVADVVSIRDNRIVAIDERGVSPWGYVENDGTLVARFTKEDGRILRIHGQLRGSAGSGAWSSSTDMCGGAWRATRGDAEHAGR